MPLIYLVRHAEPVSPALHRGPDATRPLSDRGRRQAQWTAEYLNAAQTAEVFSSPHARCRETAEIIAQALGVKATVDDRLHIASSFVAQAGVGPRVYVAHSNNIPVALDELGVDCHACAHASCWVVELDATGRVLRADYVTPPV
ncbi:MAG: histidine phosphatase family protein [Planctomycetes bacterium]|nr:histidine phosphatase family protein [Planctomycetota bacterium]MCL4731523.1 histidine phosphatase family protein [Planctomycetota bacterium]